MPYHGAVVVYTAADLPGAVVRSVAFLQAQCLNFGVAGYLATTSPCASPEPLLGREGQPVQVQATAL